MCPSYAAPSSGDGSGRGTAFPEKEIRYKAKRTQDGTSYKEDTEQMAAAGAFRHQLIRPSEAVRSALLFVPHPVYTHR